jgi:hypothetical protein
MARSLLLNTQKNAHEQPTDGGAPPLRADERDALRRAVHFDEVFGTGPPRAAPSPG